MTKTALINSENIVVSIIISPINYKIPAGFTSINIDGKAVYVGYVYNPTDETFSAPQ